MSSLVRFWGLLAPMTIMLILEEYTFRCWSMISAVAFHILHLFCNISKILNNIFKVPEVPKKPVPEEKKPVPVPKKKEAPPAKGTPPLIS